MHPCVTLLGMADSSRQRTARWRARMAGLPDPDAPQPCTQCPRLVRSRRTAPLCSRCWRSTDAWREANRLRMADARRRSSTTTTTTP